MTQAPRRQHVSMSLALIAAAAATISSGCESSPGSGAPDGASSPAALSANAATTPSTPDEPTQLVLGTEPWTFAGRTGRMIRTPSYRLFTTVSDPFIADRFPRFMELALSQYTTALGNMPRPANAMDTYLLANRPQWVDAAGALLGENDTAYKQIQRGGVTMNGRAVLYNIGGRDTFAVAAHEGWHQYSQTVMKEPLPVWLEEGIATYMEGYRWDRADRGRVLFLPWCNAERFDQLRSASDRGKLLSLAEVLNSSPQEQLAYGDDRALTYYAQVWALVHYLREGDAGDHANGLAAALNDAHAGRLSSRLASTLGSSAARSAMLRRRGPGLFLAYIDSDQARAEKSYRLFITQVVRPGAKQLIMAGTSPIAPGPQ